MNRFLNSNIMYIHLSNILKEGKQCVNKLVEFGTSPHGYTLWVMLLASFVLRFSRIDLIYPL